jgi:hypothetical protein
MAIKDFLQTPLQALMGSKSSLNLGPLQTVETAKGNPDLAPVDQRWVFVGEEIDGTRWNKSYPYQLLLLDRAQDGGYKIQQEFTLPIPPQDLSISTPFAINTSVTLGGIVEEHNGAPLRMISFSGTTGLNPLRGSTEGLGQGSVLSGIFGGTIQAGQSLIKDTKTLVGARGSETNLVSDDDRDMLKGTGYYQFRLLQRFLESYATRKKHGDQQLRLALAVWKDEAVYLVTPVSFDVRRSAQTPWEYTYQFSLKAWRRISPLSFNNNRVDPFKAVVRDPNAFAQLLNKLQEARRVLQASQEVLEAVSGDVQKTLLEPLREVTLFCKDAIGVAVTAADLPRSIVASLHSARAVATSLGGKDGTIRAGGRNIDRTAQGSWQALGPGQGAGPEAPASTGSSQSGLGAGKPPADDFDKNEATRPGDMDLPPHVQRKISEERQRIRKLTRRDFEAARDKFVEFQAQFADSIGAGSTSYNRTYNRPTVVANKTPTPDDYEVLFALNQTILEMNRLAASSDIDRQQVSTVEAVAGMASASGIAFKVPASKFAVPFPYGTTLEQLSAQYLGDPSRWHEIVALNGLRQPYVDEEGFELKLLVNGRENQVTVGNTKDLYVGQPVWISATNTSRTRRRITRIERIGTGTAILTLDGEPDLDRFNTLASANLQAFLPDTVNSQQLIYIPSDQEPSGDGFRTKSIPGIDEFDPLIHAGGTDLLLTMHGDLAITPDGDCRLAIGLTNLIQRVRTALGTPRGSLLHHPSYGLGLVPGVSTADVSARDMKASLEAMLRNDGAFSGVSGVAISKAGPVVRVSMAVGIAGTGQTIPLSVDIRQ